MKGRVFAFEGIADDLPLLPLAARRALDRVGLRLSLRAWQALGLAERRTIVAAGTPDLVAQNTVVDALRDAKPVAQPQPPDTEERLSTVPPALEAALTQASDIDDASATWQRLTRLQRFALAHVAKRADPQRTERALQEILRSAAGARAATEPDGRLTHLSAEGEARMVDVAAKTISLRRAVALAAVRMKPQTAKLVLEAAGPKGDVLAVARIAGIAAAKRTSELIPLCHQIQLTRVAVSFEVDVEHGAIHVTAAADALDRTGVEMEAMTAASVAALTVYDMLKAVERGICIEQVVLLEKSGGRSGHYRRERDTEARQ